MDSKLNEFKCPNCGALMNRTIDTYKCDYCDSELTTHEYNSYINRNVIDINTLGIGNTLDISKVIPFTKTKEDFYRLINSKIKGKIFIPSVLKRIKLEDIKSVYVPYYVFDIKANGDTLLKCTDIETKTNDDKKLVNIKTFKTTVNSNFDFIKLPVCANKDFDDSIIKFIEPFNHTKCVDMNTSINNSLLLESNISLDKAIRLVSLKCKKKVSDLVIKKTEHKISEIIKDQIKYSVINEELVNFPIFYIRKEYRGKVYTLAMNGDNGKYDIDFPVSGLKIIIYTFFFVSLVFTLVFIICLKVL